MWVKISGEPYHSYATKAANLMRDPEAFKAAMGTAVKQWPVSAEHNLTAIECNRRAWLGHAGCFFGVGSPEEPTRIGWHQLSSVEQFEADRVAQEVIEAWEEEYCSLNGQGELFPEGAKRQKGRTSTDA